MADATGAGEAGIHPRPFVRDFRQILLWPIQLLPPAEGAQPRDPGFMPCCCASLAWLSPSRSPTRWPASFGRWRLGKKSTEIRNWLPSDHYQTTRDGASACEEVPGQ